MELYEINPLTDPRWGELVSNHPSGSVFHTPSWLSVLRAVYGYEPLVLTTCGPAAGLTNGLPLCRIQSLLTGRRLVSLPFSDHCEPLGDTEADVELLLLAIAESRCKTKSDVLQLRPAQVRPPAGVGFAPAARYLWHRLCLVGGSSGVFKQFHRDCVQRKIRRADREGIVYEEGRGADIVREFYRLLLMTRRRHRLLPQPLTFFQEMAASLGEKIKVRVARKGQTAIASVVTLEFNGSMVYKYGCSDARYHNLGGLQMLLWRSIQEAIAHGDREFDFGRSDLDHEGLAVFKDRWGATRWPLVYWSTPAPRGSIRLWNQPWARGAFARMPDWMLAASGRLLYRHIG